MYAPAVSPSLHRSCGHLCFDQGRAGRSSALSGFTPRSSSEPHLRASPRQEFWRSPPPDRRHRSPARHRGNHQRHSRERGFASRPTVLSAAAARPWSTRRRRTPRRPPRRQPRRQGGAGRQGRRQDVDGTVHTRYEARTCAWAFPCWVATLSSTPPSRVGAVSLRRTRPRSRWRPSRRASPAGRPRSRRSPPPRRSPAGSEADGARKVIWAGFRARPSSPTRRSSVASRTDGTPNQLHVITDATTGEKLFEYQGIENATHRQDPLLRQRRCARCHPVRLDLLCSCTTPHQRAAATDDGPEPGPQDLRHRHPGHQLDQHLSEPAPRPAPRPTRPRRRRRLRRPGDLGLLQEHLRPQRHHRTTVRRPTRRVHYGNAYVNAFWDDSCFCMTYGDGSGNTDPLTSLDVAGHEMTPRRHLQHRRPELLG